MAKIIISYRRSDSDVFAGRVRDRIAGRYGDDSVFIDVDNIPFGKDFRVHIQEALAEADAVLVIIGPKWLGANKIGFSRIANKTGLSRIMDDRDPVRIEVESALGKGIPTIPVLVGKTNMPRVEQLPESLKTFAFINAASVDTGRDFHRDLDRVIATIDGILKPPIGRAESAATLTSLKIEQERATVITPKTVEASREEQTILADSNSATMRDIRPITQQPSFADMTKRAGESDSARSTRIPSSASDSRQPVYPRRVMLSIAIICGCILLVGISWWILNAIPRTNTAVNFAPPLSSQFNANDQDRNVTREAVIGSFPQSVEPGPKGAENSTPDPGADVVRAFYAALGRGDGVSAAAFVVPERQKGGLNPQEMTRFFSGLFKPLQLIRVVPYGQNSYQATYTYQASAKNVCNNSVVVVVTQRDGRFLIQSVDAHGGC